jgi:aromatic ring-opening dioxygenase LigB subunit
MRPGFLMTAVLPHAPMLIGAVGGELAHQAAPLVAAIERLVRDVVRVNPETIVLATPHAPLAFDAFGIHVGDVLRGSFAHHGLPTLVRQFENDLALVDEIIGEVLDRRMRVFEIPDGTPLDHGALVPLHFLHEAGWRGRVVVLGSSYLPERDHILCGRCVERAAGALERRAVFIASANLSHRLSATAPYGYHPRAGEFDREIVSSLESGEFARLSRIAPELRALAVECGHRPILIAAGAAHEVPLRHRVLCYMYPFGIGHVVAILADRRQEEPVFAS